MDEVMLRHKIARCKVFMGRYEARLDDLSKHGYQAYGYYIGKIAALEAMLNSIEEGVLDEK